MKTKTIPLSLPDVAPGPGDQLLARVGTPSPRLCAPDPAAPTRAEHLTLHGKSGGGYIVARRTEEHGVTLDEAAWVLDTPEAIERVLGRGPVARALYHQAQLPTPCTRDRDGLLDISAVAIRIALWSHLHDRPPTADLREAGERSGAMVALVWPRTFGTGSPEDFPDTQALRRHIRTLNRSAMRVTAWREDQCLHVWRLWHERRAIEIFEHASLERSA